MANRKASDSIDWVLVHNLFRLGEYSLRQIARIVDCSEGAIRAKAKECGWTADLQERVQRAKRKVLMPASDEDLVKVAATVVADVVRSHREDILRLRDTAAQTERFVAGLVKELPTADKPFEAAEKVTSALLKLGLLTAQLVPLERQAFGIEGPVTVRTVEEQEEWDDDFILREAEIIRLKRAMGDH